MRKRFVLVIVAVVAATIAIVGAVTIPSSAARRPTIRFHAFLNGAQEVPATTSDAFGVAHITLKGTRFCYEIAYTTLSSAETGAHIHRGARGQEGGVVYDLNGMGADNPKVACVFNVEAALNDAQFIEDLKAGNLYINIHGTGDPLSDGEIRGQIVRD